MTITKRIAEKRASVQNIAMVESRSRVCRQIGTERRFRFRKPKVSIILLGP